MGEPCEETCEDEAKKEQSRSNKGISKLRTFSEFLVKALKSLPDIEEEKKKEILKCCKKERIQLGFNVPTYQMKQACYAWNKFLEEHAKIDMITSFTGDCSDYSTPDYDQIEIKRDKRITLLTSGWMFFYYKGIGYAAWFYFSGTSPHVNLYLNKKHKEKGVALIDAVRVYMRDFNFLKGERLKLVDGYWFKFLDYAKMKWKDIILPKKIKDEIFLNIVFPLANEELCKKNGVPWRRGVLLGGEPGTGKTKLAKILCNVLDGCTVIWVTAESITQSNHVKMLFQAARYFSPTLIVMEDIDFFGKDRSMESSPIVGEMLTQLDGSSPNDGIFVLASSNRPGLLDKALANRPGRFDVRLEVKLPDKKCRLELINLFSKNKQFDSNVNFDSLANKTDGLTGAHIQEALVYAMLESLYGGSNQIQNKSLNKAITRMKGRPKLSMVS